MVDASIWSSIGYQYYSRVISNINYNFLFEDYPIQNKLAGAAALGVFVGIPSLIFGLGVADGLVDVVKGTHHYFGCRVWQRLTKNQAKKEEIERELEQMSKMIKYPISLKASNKQ